MIATLIKLWFALWQKRPRSNTAQVPLTQNQSDDRSSLWEAEIPADSQALSAQLFRFSIPGAAEQPPGQLEHAVCRQHVLARAGAELPQPKLQKVQDGIRFGRCMLHFPILGAAQRPQT